MSQPNHAEIERLAKLTEEAGEVVQACMKIVRFGYTSSYDSGKINRDQLEEEISNFLCIFDYMVGCGDLNADKIKKARFEHGSKMLRHFRYQK